MNAEKYTENSRIASKMYTFTSRDNLLEVNLAENNINTEKEGGFEVSTR